MIEDWKNKFLQTKQPALKLQIAMEHYFIEEAEKEWKERCGEYIKQRIRPALDLLIRENDAEKTEKLLAAGWVSESLLDEAIAKAGSFRRAEILTILLRWKHCGGKSGNPGNGMAYLVHDVREKERICGKIWKLTILSLNERYPFFRKFLCSFKFRSREEIPRKEDSFRIGLEGLTVYYEPDFLIERFRRGSNEAEHLLLHMMIHVLFLHTVTEPMENVRIWNLACDMAAERILRAVAGDPGFCCKEEIRPEYLYRELTEALLCEEELEKEEDIYQVDDHSLWGGAEKKRTLECLKEHWKEIGKCSGAGFLGGSKGSGGREGADAEMLHIQKGGKADFREFLSRFARTGEELMLDMDSIDYIPYLFGLEQYGNMPLVEHLEYCEVRKLEELVIAIDTSGSCKTETVRRFMEEVYGIFSAQENFFQRMNVYILQCDFMVQHVAHITCEKEWRSYMDQLVIHGRGDTDFQPVFRYVNSLMEEKKLKNLKALFYFTDGDGIYPKEATDYTAAFVLYHRKIDPKRIPVWIRQFELEDL